MTTTTVRRCSGSARFGIEPHEAPTAEFPKQPSRKDGLGTMCTEHWRAYVKGLREARRAATAEVAEALEPEAEVAEPEAPAPRTTRRRRATVEPEQEVDAA